MFFGELDQWNELLRREDLYRSLGIEDCRRIWSALLRSNAAGGGPPDLSVHALPLPAVGVSFDALTNEGADGWCQSLLEFASRLRAEGHDLATRAHMIAVRVAASGRVPFVGFAFARWHEIN